MTWVEFSGIMEKIKSFYGERNYNEARIQLLWNRIGNEPENLFRKAIETLFFKTNHPPSIEKICESIAESRSDVYRSEKNHYSTYGMDAWSKIKDEELRMRFDFIKGRVEGKMPQKDWEDFLRHLKSNLTKDRVNQS